MTTNGKLPPNAYDLEAALLGGVLQDARFLIDVRAILQTPNDLFSLKHAYTFEAMCRLADRHEVIDLLSVGAELQALGRFEDVGGDAFLADLVAACPYPPNTPDYAKTVRERAYDRELLKAADGLRTLALDGKLAGREKRAKAEALVTDSGYSGGDDGMVGARDLMSAYFDDIEATQHLGPGVSGLSTGFADLDELLDGLQDQSVNFVAGRPGMGKSSLLMTMAYRMALVGKRGYYWSGEMSRKQLRQRLMSVHTALQGATLRRGLRPGGLDPAQHQKFLRGIDALSKLQLVFDDAEEMTPTLLRAHADLTARRLGGLDFICVDYIGLLEPGVRKENRDKELGYISRKLKTSLATVAPVLCAAQLSRSVEAREDKRPQLRDLRDSGTQEQDADVVMFLYRDVQYNPQTLDPTRADVIVAKNRHGATGAVALHFDKSTTAFSDARLKTVDLRGLSA